MNVLGYIIFLIIAYIITVHVGLVLFRKGRVYILNLMENDVAYSDAINKLLLVGYFLLNLGYATVMISFWNQINSIAELVSSIATMLGRLIITLAILHYFNMLAILGLSIQHKKSLKK